MKDRLSLMLFFTAFVALWFWPTAQALAVEASGLAEVSRGGVSGLSEQQLLSLWSVWALLLLGSWGWRLYVFLYYRRVKAEFVRWVPSRPRSKRLYPEYAFEVAGKHYPLVNRHSLNNDEPRPMVVLHHPTKPSKALFLTFMNFVGRPLLEMLSFACITSVLLSRMDGWSGLFTKILMLF